MGTILFSGLMLWLIVTVTFALFQNWRLWAWSTGGLFLIGLASLIAGNGVLAFEMIGGMSIYFWPIGLGVSTLIWITNTAVKSVRETKGSK
jgi:hypothetical protein